MPSPSEDTPVLLIVAGPNGSGKSSAYEHADIEMGGRSLWIVNPDILSVRIHRVEHEPYERANRHALDRIEAWLKASIAVHKNIGVETVLSTDKYRAMVAFAKSYGFDLWLYYVCLDDPERNVNRVRMRVEKGGHAVPEDKIRARFRRSLEQLPWFLDQADRAWLFDNSGAHPVLVGEKADGVLTLDPATPWVLQEALSGLGGEA